MAAWLEPEAVEIPEALRAFVGGHPLVAETLVRRGYRTVAAARAFLDPDAYTPAPPEALPGMAKAVARIGQALEAGERICVWGDFDVDGQTATTLLVSTLRDLGADVIYHIPVRATESHGVRLPWLADELARGATLLLTCDTGVDAHEAVDYAAEAGVDVIITDHHELPATLPDAYALINPHLLPDDHPLATLPGVGVAYEVAEALYREAGRPEAATSLLDLVALGIVADVAVQIGDTRYLLQRGLAVLRETRRLGLQELMKLSGINGQEVDEEDIGFGIGPRLNALGRLDDARDVVEFLTTDTLSRARILASKLEALNERRKLACDQVQAAAEAKLERHPDLLDAPVLVLAEPTWPPGVIGIVANRLVEQHHRPVVLLANPEGEVARGSARSVEGCHITEAIASQAALLESFGGHAMAAGLAIQPEHLPAFRRGLARAVTAQLERAPVTPALQLHGYVTLGELSLTLVDDLERLAPFGAGNPPLVLAAHDLQVIAKRTLGRGGHHVRVTVEDQERVTRNVVWWQWRNAPLPEGRFDLAFTVRVNEFRGKVDVQLVWEDARSAPEAMPETEVEVQPEAWEILDFRSLEDAAARSALAELIAVEPSVAVWVEGAERDHVSGSTRAELKPAQTLAIWSPPPGPEALRVALRRVKPASVALFDRPAALDRPQPFLAYFAGLVKYALRERDGRISVPEVAAVMGHREVAVRLGLAWLAAKGHVRVHDSGEMVVRLDAAEAPAPDRDGERRIMASLTSVLAETAAYRRFFVTSGEFPQITN